MLQDSRACAAVVSSELYARVAEVLGRASGLEHVLVSGDAVGGEPAYSSAWRPA